MIRLAANLSLLFTEHPFLDRFHAAADAGFDYVECQFVEREAPVFAVTEAADRAGVRMVLINADAGDLDRGEFGLALADPARFAASLDSVADYAEALGVRRVHVLAGMVAGGEAGPELFARLRDAYELAADRLGAAGADLVIEPLNPADRPGYALTSFDMAADLIAALDRPNVKLQFDAYHAARCGHAVLRRLEIDLPFIGHVQVAAARDRGEPEAADRVDALFERLEAAGYAGFVGCEYNPRAGTAAGLDWARPWLEWAGSVPPA